MRGLAALYVVLYHAAGDNPPPAPVLRIAAWFLQFGHYAVGVFIVLSGFCLILPVVQSPDRRLRSGLWGYLKRRAWRILPAYYVVLALTTAGVAVVRLQHPLLTGEEADVLNLSSGTLFSHLLLLHNLREAWAQAFDPPMWTVALECQIYLLFPLVLLPIWRRFGTLAVVCCGFAIGFAPHLFLPAPINLDWTFPWFLGLFCLGMAGAVLCFSPRPIPAQGTSRFPNEAAGLVLLVLFAVIAGLNPDLSVGRMWLPDIVLGLAIMCLIVAFAKHKSRQAWDICWNDSPVRPGLLPILEWRPLAAISAFSYSLYLLHAPVLWALFPVIHALRISENGAFLFRLLLGVPLCLAVSYGFYLVVERPCLLRKR